MNGVQTEKSLPNFQNPLTFPTFAALKLKKQVMNNYETVFILNPVLSEEQAKDTVEKFVNVLTKANAEIINAENWGLKKLAYPINKKSTGFTTSSNLRQNLRSSTLWKQSTDETSQLCVF